MLLKARSKFAKEIDKGRRLKNKTQTAHWTTFCEKWKMANQENTNMPCPLSVSPRRKIRLIFKFYFVISPNHYGVT